MLSTLADTYSNFTPAPVTTFCHVAVSALTKFTNSAGVCGAAVTPLSIEPLLQIGQCQRLHHRRVNFRNDGLWSAFGHCIALPDSNDKIQECQIP